MTFPNFKDAAFYAAIEAKRHAERLSWRQLGRQLGLSPSTFSRIARGRRPDVETFLRLLAWLNVPADTFIDQGDSEKSTDTMSVIAATLHADSTMPSGAAGALEQLMRVAYANLTTMQATTQSKTNLTPPRTRRKR